MSKFNIVKEAYSFATFSAYDYASVKRILIERIRNEFPETFNDYTEFNELIMIINSFAYISELFAYRLDINAQENFIQLSSIKENVVRLAQWIGYNPKRCIPARGLFKLQSVTPTFDIIDNRGENLRDRTIRWNDPNNVFWKSQFFSIIQDCINEELLNPSVNNRVQINNTVIEKYSLENISTKFGTIQFKTNNNTTFEILSSNVYENGFIENYPRNTNKNSLYYLDDNSSDSSPTTGFFFDCTQGSINSISLSFSDVVPNRVVDLNISDVNEFDIWLYEINTDTFWTNSNKLYFINKSTNKLFKINTINDVSIEIEFGDGVVSDIPVGDFVLFYRTSINENTLHDKNLLSNLSINIPLFVNNQRVVLNATISCESDLYSNAAENMQHIKRVASSLYQTQDRLVTEFDYNNFLLQDNRILCAKPYNIKSIGESSYFKWMQQSDSNYTQLFDDSAICLDNEIQTDTYNDLTNEDVISTIETLLTKNTIIQAQSVLYGVNPSRTKFNRNTGSEYDQLLSRLGSNNNTLLSFPFSLSKSTTTDLWEINNTSRVNGNPVWRYNDVIIVDKIPTSTNIVWKIYSKNTNIVVFKNATTFIHNDNIDKQQFTIHPYNSSYNNNYINGTFVFNGGSDKIYNGMLVKNAVNLIGKDTDNNMIPNVIDLHNNINISTKTYTCNTYVDGIYRYIDVPYDNLPVVPYTQDIVRITDNANVSVDFEYSTNNYTPTRQIKVLTTSPVVYVEIKQYVFFEKGTNYTILNNSYDVFNKIIAVDDNHPTYTRMIGKKNILVKYIFRIPFYQVLNPEQTNLIRIVLITQQMLESFKKFLTINTTYTADTPFDLNNNFSYLLDKSMFTDNVSLVPGKISPFIGSKSNISRRFVINVKKNPEGFMLPIDIKNNIINILTDAFNSDYVLGEVIYTSQIIGVIMYKLSQEILDLSITSLNPLTFGEEIDVIQSDEDELLYPHINYSDIVIR